MQFGSFVPQGWRMDLVGIDQGAHWTTMADLAQRMESAGFDSIWVYDHFHTVPTPTQEPTYDAWTLMAAFATVTSSVKLGQMCTSNSYRPPAYLAKVAASIDVISGGRVQMGIGAGWYEHEYLGYGYEFPKPSVRIGQLREGVEIMKRMWTEDEVHFDGTYYTLQGAICQPKPMQEPHIPVWVAGGGEQLTLRVAARSGDYTNFGGGNVESFTHKSGVLARHCAEVGRDFDEIVRSTSFNIICAPTEAEAINRMEAVRERFAPYIDAERLRNLGKDWVVGTPEQLSEAFDSWDGSGMEYAIVYFPDAAYAPEGFELFAKEVIPSVR